MSTTLSLLIVIIMLAVAIGMFGAFVGSTDEQKRRRRSEHEARRVARQPWDDADGRSNR